MPPPKRSIKSTRIQNIANESTEDDHEESEERRVRMARLRLNFIKEQLLCIHVVISYFAMW